MAIRQPGSEEANVFGTRGSVLAVGLGFEPVPVSKDTSRAHLKTLIVYDTVDIFDPI
jgi:hypothetical protein